MTWWRKLITRRQFLQGTAAVAVAAKAPRRRKGIYSDTYQDRY